MKPIEVFQDGVHSQPFQTQQSEPGVASLLKGSGIWI